LQTLFSVCGLTHESTVITLLCTKQYWRLWSWSRTNFRLNSSKRSLVWTALVSDVNCISVSFMNFQDTMLRCRLQATLFHSSTVEYACMDRHAFHYCWNALLKFRCQTLTRTFRLLTLNYWIMRRRVIGLFLTPRCTYRDTDSQTRLETFHCFSWRSSCNVTLPNNWSRYFFFTFFETDRRPSVVGRCN
jgi:hypothetical protein